jgi:hypothetical protein
MQMLSWRAHVGMRMSGDDVRGEPERRQQVERGTRYSSKK